MLYFIPAWYEEKEWCEDEQSWRVKRAHSEFDDTVKQIQLFHRSGAYEYRIMLLSAAPNFRHFLHRQGVYRAPYWSCFDAIQEIRRRKVRVWSFHDLKWPEGIEFLYTPFVVVAMLGNEKYAQVDFGEDGNPIWVELYQGGVVCRRNLYDDRGFIASTILYEGGQPVCQDYLCENGTWKLRCYRKDGHVEINRKCPEYLLEYGGKWHTRRFFRRSYDSIGQVVYEVLASYLELTDAGDIFCVAMHGLHVHLLGRNLRGRKKILSFFQDRYQVGSDSVVLEMIRQADYVVADSRETARRIQKQVAVDKRRLAAIPPYDTRTDEGIGLQMGVQKILVPVDGLDDGTFREMIRIMGAYLPQKENMRIHLFTREARYDRKRRLLEQVRRELDSAGMPEEWAADTEGAMVSENDLEGEGRSSARFFPEQCVDELSVSKCMREQWLLVDLRNVPEQYLQINAISFGIPQIVRRRTDFIEHGGNGIVLDGLERLPKALDYYLNGLKHWNEAKVYSYEISREYTTARLLEMWGEVMDSVG